jgi:EmrB/QacA subfamily drug resistance transporter
MQGNRLKWYTLGAACIALFMAILDNLVVNVALPTISRDLNATTTQLQWIVSAYTLVFASLQITAGGLGDRFGRKRFFLIGLGLFTTASILGALSQNIGMLIAARAVQGLGAAFIMPLSLSLISVAFPPEERGKALGIWSAISVSGLAFGPIVGGALVEYANWHWVFLINVPIGIVAFFVSTAVIKESRDTSGTVATDIPGTIIITGAIAALTWGLIEAGDRGWGDTLILTAFGVAVALFAAFIAVESRTKRPMVPLRFFRSTTFSGANMDAFAVSFLIAGVAFYMTLYQQNIHGYSPVRAGLTMLPMVIVMMVCSPVSGILVGRIGARSLISLGMAVGGLGTLLFLRGGVGATYLTILPAYLVMGAGMSLIFAPMTTAVMNSVESEKSGVASAVNGAIREIGSAFGIALLGTVMNRVYKADFTADPAIVQARGDAALSPLHKVIDLIGSGASFAGRVIEDPAHFPGLPAPLVAAIRDASGHAFIAGMDRAIVVSSVTIIAASVVSFFLIRERQPAIAPVPVPDVAAPIAPAIAELPAPVAATAPASAVSAAEPVLDVESDPLVAAFARMVAEQVAAAQEPVTERIAALERAVQEIAWERGARPGEAPANLPLDEGDYIPEPVPAGRS